MLYTQKNTRNIIHWDGLNLYYAEIIILTKEYEIYDKYSKKSERNGKYFINKL